jgi:hypothetical protein
MGAEPAADFIFGQFLVMHGLAGFGDEWGREHAPRSAQQHGGGQRGFSDGFQKSTAAAARRIAS